MLCRDPENQEIVTTASPALARRALRHTFRRREHERFATAKQRFTRGHSSEFKVMLNKEPIDGPRLTTQKLEQARENGEGLAVFTKLGAGVAIAARCFAEHEDFVFRRSVCTMLAFVPSIFANEAASSISDLDKMVAVCTRPRFRAAFRA